MIFTKKNIAICIVLIFSLILSPLWSQQITVTPVKINSPTSDEYAPVIHNSHIYFVSNRKSAFLANVFDQNNEHLHKIYLAPISPTGETGSVSLFNDISNNALMVGPFTISADGSIIIVTQTKEGNLEKARKSNNELTLFESKKEGDNWQSPQNIPLSIGNHSVAQPSLSPDGKRLFFVSNKPGGYGETDIYVSTLLPNGWGEPQNLGSVVNSSSRELFPFYHSSGKLYFSSDGHGGMGGLDIFYSIELEQGWSKPIALDAPVNSKFDDFSCFIYIDEISGYFASNRQGSDNIYRYEYELEYCSTPNEVEEENYCFTFFEESAFDLDTLPYQYRWEFNDKVFAYGDEVDHCFPGPGMYEVFLHVIDTETGEELYAVANYELNLEKPKQVYFTVPEKVKVNERIVLQAELTGFEDVGDVQYFWDVNDGERRIGQTIHHSFKRKGTYTLTCEAYWNGNTICSFRTIIVE